MRIGIPGKNVLIRQKGIGYRDVLSIRIKEKGTRGSSSCMAMRSLLHSFMVPGFRGRPTEKLKWCYGNAVSKCVSGDASRKGLFLLNVTLTSNMENEEYEERPARGFGRGQCRLDVRYYYPDLLVFSSWPTNTLRKFLPYHGSHCSTMT